MIRIYGWNEVRDMVVGPNTHIGVHCRWCGEHVYVLYERESCGYRLLEEAAHAEHTCFSILVIEAATAVVGGDDAR